MVCDRMHHFSDFILHAFLSWKIIICIFPSLVWEVLLYELLTETYLRQPIAVQLNLSTVLYKSAIFLFSERKLLINWDVLQRMKFFWNKQSTPIRKWYVCQFALKSYWHTNVCRDTWGSHCGEHVVDVALGCANV